MRGGQQEVAVVAGGERTPSRTRVEAVGMGKAAILGTGLKGVQGELQPSNKPRCALAEGVGEPGKLRRQRLASGRPAERKTESEQGRERQHPYLTLSETDPSLALLLDT